MYVGLVIYGSLDTLSGGYLYDRRLVDYLRRQGDEVDVISLPWRTYAHHLMDNVSSDLYRRLRSATFDVLVQDELNHPSLVWLNRRLRSQVEYPMVSIVHHLRSSESRPVWQNHVYRWIETRYLEMLDGFIYNSETTRAVVERLVEERPGVVAYPAGDHLSTEITRDEIAARAQEAGPLRVMFVGNVIHRKGLDTLISALAYVDTDVRLTVIGSMETEPAYVRTIEGMLANGDVGRHVDVLGALSHDEIASQLARHHVFAMPSRYEGFGIVYLEALAFGLPVIASTAGAAHELVSPGETGYLVPPDTPRAVARPLDTLAGDRSLLRRMSLAARERYESHPTWDASMACAREFLRDLAID